MARCLRVQFDGNWYSWFDCDELARTKLDRIPSILRKNISHYFNIPEKDQVLFGSDGEVASDADIHRILCAAEPSIIVHDRRHNPQVHSPSGIFTNDLPAGAFEVKLVKRPNELYGFTNIPCSTALVVSSIEAGGILDTWNHTFPGRVVTPGDVILRVNNEKEPHAMRNQFYTNQLAMVLRRSSSFQALDEIGSLSHSPPCHSPPNTHFSPPAYISAPGTIFRKTESANQYPPNLGGFPSRRNREEQRPNSIERMQNACNQSLFTAMDEMSHRCARERRADIEAMKVYMTSLQSEGTGKETRKTAKKKETRVEQIVREVVLALDHDSDDNSTASSDRGRPNQSSGKEIRALRKAHTAELESLKKLVLDTNRDDDRQKLAESVQKVEETVANLQLLRSVDVARLDKLQDGAGDKQNLLRALDEQLQNNGHLGIQELCTAYSESKKMIEEAMRTVGEARNAMQADVKDVHHAVETQLSDFRLQLEQTQTIARAEPNGKTQLSEHEQKIRDLVQQVQEQKREHDALVKRVHTLQNQPIQRTPSVPAGAPISVRSGLSAAKDGSEAYVSDGITTKHGVSAAKDGSEAYVSDGSTTDDAVALVLNRFGGATIAGDLWSHVSGNTYMWGSKRLWIKATEGEDPKVRVGGVVTRLADYLQQTLLRGSSVQIQPKVPPKVSPKVSPKAKLVKAKAKRTVRAQEDSDSSVGFGANPYAGVV